MKSVNIFSKVFVLATLWTVVFLGLAGYAGNKTLEQDPEIVQKIADKKNIVIHIGGMSKKYGSKSYVDTKKSWTFPATATQITLKSIGGNFSVKKTNGTEIVVTATGGLDSNRGPELLDTNQDGTTLTLKEPENEAVRGLEVNIEIPATLISTFDIHTVSGDMTFENTQLKDFAVKSVSGDLNWNNVTAENLTFSTVSSDLKILDSNVKTVKGKTVSGDVEFNNNKPANLDVTSVSGDVKMKLAKSQDTNFNLKTTSGEIENAHASNKSGTVAVTILTTSGDIEIQ